MLEGVAGRPAEMRLIVEGKGAEGIKVGMGERLMVEGGSSGGQLLLTAPGAPERLSESQMALRRDKGKGRAEQGKDVQFVDWDKPTAEEEEANKAPRLDEMQVPIDSWGFTVSHAYSSLAFARTSLIDHLTHDRTATRSCSHPTPTSTRSTLRLPPPSRQRQQSPLPPPKTVLCSPLANPRACATTPLDWRSSRRAPVWIR